VFGQEPELGGKTGKNYRDPAVRKGAQGRTIL